MRFWKAISKGKLLSAVVLILLPSLGFAGPLFPDVRVSSSSNGKYLVVVEETFDNPDAGVRRVLQRTYVVLQSEPFINYGNRLQSATQFWSSSGSQCWQVTPAGATSQSIYLPMISNDGQILVLVLVSPPMGDQEVVRIYHREGNKAKLIRAVKLSGFWTADEMKTYVGPASDETPMWYAGATLEFSSDDQDLLFRSRWNDTVKINLADDSKADDSKMFEPKQMSLGWK
jgi:hypothetical protein